MSFAFVAPRLMQIGGGCVADVASVLGKLDLARPLIVTDPFMVESGLLDACLTPLRRAGIPVDIFAATVPEPTDRVVAVGVERMREQAYDCLIGFGGGSPIDTAKAMAILATREGAAMSDFKVPAVADEAAVPVIAIPTTAGTGTEATRFTVITDTARGEKMLIAGLGALPIAALVDYELTYTVPPRTTADTGVDSLTHALEAFVSRRANAFSDALALSAMALIGKHLRAAYAHPRDGIARAAMMLAATQAGMAFCNSSVALVHGMSRPIGAGFHVPHGLSNAMLLPAVTRFSLPGAPERYAKAARAIGLAGSGDADAEACETLVAGLVALNRDLDVPTPRAFGIERDAWFGRIDVMAGQAIDSGSPANNPRVAERSEIVALYQSIWA